MVDLKKEIKLSDLRPKRKPKAAGAVTVQSVARKAPRKQEIVGVKVGGSQIAAAHVLNDRGAKLLRLAREPLGRGIVVDGEVREVAELGQALDAFFKKYDLPRKNVRLGIGTNRVGVRSLDIEGIEDERQLANAVTFRAYEVLSIPTDLAVLDYRVVGSSVNADSQVSHRVVIAAAYREPIERFVAAFNAAGIELAGVDVEAFALLRAVAPPEHSLDPDKQTAVVALSVGHDRTTLAISDGAICDFTRVLDWGGARLDVALSRELGVTEDEASELKLSLSLDDDDRESDRARGAVRAELTNLARELVASLQFYQSQPSSLALAEILVTGGTTQMPGFVEELERLVRARVRVADPLVAVAAPADALGRGDLASLAIAIGLAVER